MHLRFRTATSLDNLFSAPALCSTDRDRLPEVGDAFTLGSISYRIIKVLEDVDPDYGTIKRGPVVYVMRVDLPADPYAPRHGKLSLAFLINTSRGLRNCIERAHAARRLGHSDRYRQHVEEFLFLSNAISSSMLPGVPARSDRGEIPFMPMYVERDGLDGLLRDGLITCAFSALVYSVRTLDVLDAMLDRLDRDRPTLVIIAAHLRLHSGLSALHAIRSHANGRLLPVLVLTHHDREHDAILAMAAGATAHDAFPETRDAYQTLATKMRELVRQRSWETGAERLGS